MRAAIGSQKPPDHKVPPLVKHEEFKQIYIIYWILPDKTQYSIEKAYTDHERALEALSLLKTDTSKEWNIVSIDLIRGKR